MSRATTTRMAVLGLLADGERSGYDLAALARRSIEAMWTPSRSQIYKVLPRLVADGLAASRAVPQSGRPDKELYRATPAGAAALGAWVAAVDPPEQGDPGVYLLKIFFGRFAPEQAALDQLAAYRILLETRLAGWEAQLDGLAPDEPVHSRAALLHGIARARATLSWVDETRVLLSAPR